MDTIGNASKTIRVFVPVGRTAQAQATRARRSETIPAVIGLLDNHKHNTAKVLDRLQHRLQERYPEMRVVRAQKPEAGKGAPKVVLDALAHECQAVINGIGD